MILLLSRQEGQENVNDDARSGRPSRFTADEVVKENCRLITIREVAKDAGISIGSCHAIFSYVLRIKRVVAKFFFEIATFCPKEASHFSTKNNTVIVTPTPHSPYLAPCGFFLAAKVKRPTKGVLWQKCFGDCKKRRHKCTVPKGDYFAVDKINIDE